MKKPSLDFILLFVIFFCLSCSQKKNDVFPVIDFIKGQIAKVDSSHDSIFRLMPVTDSTYDTSYLKKDEFNRLARDFIETPDVSKKFGGKYAEERMMNNDLGLVVFIATPSDEDLEVRRQEVRILPGPPDDKIKSVYIERYKNYDDSSVLKRMTWYTDQKFQVVTMVQKKNGEEKTSVVEVNWNKKQSE